MYWFEVDFAWERCSAVVVNPECDLNQRQLIHFYCYYYIHFYPFFFEIVTLIIKYIKTNLKVK